MGYTKPGVLINQVQETISPSLVTPDLYAAIIGRPYRVFKPGQVVYSGYWVPTEGVETIPLSTLLTAQYPNVSGLIDEKSIYVDLVGVSGVLAGQRVAASYNNASGAASSSYDCSYSSGNLIVSGTTANYTSLYSGTAFRVNVGFRVLRGDLQKAVVFEGGSDIQEAIGPVSVFNELGTALTIAASNSNSRTYAYGIVGTTSTDHESAQDALSSTNSYVYAPLTNDWPTNITSWREFVESQSTAENKKESIVISSPLVPWRDTNYSNTTTKSNTAIDVAARGAITQSRRTVMIHPDVAYIRETLHISQIKQAYLSNTIDSTIYTNYNLFALLTGSIILSDGTKYFVNDEITDTVWTNLYNDGIRELTVLVPVPGYYLACAIAGQVSGETPEQPFTNVSIGGIERVKYSSDWFSNANLNTMAAGGAYIMMQDQPTLPVYTRHQLTTDTSTVETQELSIVKSVDYTAKYLRDNMKDTIGRNNITDRYLKLLKLIIKGIGTQLVNKGVLADFKLLELKQDETQRDKVKIKVSILAQYPANYIEVDLIF